MDRREAYAAKLRDPRWQKLRLEVFERDGWACRICGSKEKTLHVHHARYEPGDPWDTRSEFLFTACGDCHEDEHRYYADELNDLLAVLASFGIITSLDLCQLSQGFLGKLDFVAERDKDKPTTRRFAFADAVLEFEPPARLSGGA